MRAIAVIVILLLGPTPGLQAQAAARPLPTWRAELILPSITDQPRATAAPLGLEGNSATRSHTLTGLLVGGIIGVAAATVFLIGFCDGPDTKCEIDEVGRAMVFIAVPIAAVGALIGTLIRTEDQPTEP